MKFVGIGLLFRCEVESTAARLGIGSQVESKLG